MDVKFEASRGRILGVEDFKAVWDTMEGGCIKDTMYKPAAFPAGVPRVMGLQGAPEDAGIWFRESMDKITWAASCRRSHRVTARLRQRRPSVLAWLRS
jgi:hypothetical protein